jgi:hypothetical protein
MAQLTFKRTVSGTVTDNAGLPMPGVSVLVKGTKSGTQSTFDGGILKQAQIKSIFSYTGMRTQETATSSNVNVKLKRRS